MDFPKLERKFIPSCQIFWEPRENVEHCFEEGLENYQLSHGQAYVGIPPYLRLPLVLWKLYKYNVIIRPLHNQLSKCCGKCLGIVSFFKTWQKPSSGKSKIAVHVCPDVFSIHCYVLNTLCTQPAQKISSPRINRLSNIWNPSKTFFKWCWNSIQKSASHLNLSRHSFVSKTSL